MKRSLFVNGIAFFFIFLFLYTGITKLMAIDQFKEQMVSSPLLSPLAGLITWALPIGEIILAVILFIPILRIKGLYLSAITMSLFTLYVIIILLIDSHLSCSCGGIVEELSPRQHLLFNSASTILAILTILINRKRQPTTRFTLLTVTPSIGLFLFIGWTLFTAFTAPPSVKTGLEGRPLPSFNILLPDSVTYLNTSDIAFGKPSIFIGFSPTCTHCIQLTKDIISHIDKFKLANIYFVTPFAWKDMNIYYRYFKLARYSNISIGVDVKSYFPSYFKMEATPFIAIYDSRKRLKQAMSGQVNVNDLIKAVAE